MKLGRPLGLAIRELITIVTPRTFARWVNGDGQLRRKRRKPGAAPARPRTPEEVRAFVVRLAQENDWGYTRILGESQAQRDQDFPPNGEEHPGGPWTRSWSERGESSWEEFLKMHAQTLWACDFFSKHVWTKAGLVEYFVLFFIHVGTRRVHLAGMSARPNKVWIAEQARAVAPVLGELGPGKLLLHNFDGKYTKEFDQILQASGLEVKRVGPQKPNQNAYAERWVQSLQKSAWIGSSCLAKTTCTTSFRSTSSTTTKSGHTRREIICRCRSKGRRN